MERVIILQALGLGVRKQNKTTRLYLVINYKGRKLIQICQSVILREGSLRWWQVITVKWKLLLVGTGLTDASNRSNLVHDSKLFLLYLLFLSFSFSLSTCYCHFVFQDKSGKDLKSCLSNLFLAFFCEKAARRKCKNEIYTNFQPLLGQASIFKLNWTSDQVLVIAHHSETQTIQFIIQYAWLLFMRDCIPVSASVSWTQQSVLIIQISVYFWAMSNSINLSTYSNSSFFMYQLYKQ